MQTKENRSHSPSNQKPVLRGKRFLHAGLIFALMLGAAFCLSACSSTIEIAGKAVERSATELDLNGCNIGDAETVKDLKKLRSLAALDLRDNPLSAEAFDAIQAMIPACSIRWSVPIGAQRYDSESETLKAADFSQADIDQIRYFPNLLSLDASGSADYAALISAQDAYPGVDIVWNITAAGKTFLNSEDTIACAAGTTAAEAASLLAALPKLKSIDLRDTDLVANDIAAYQSQYPDVQFLTDEYLLGERFDAAAISLKLTNTDAFNAATLGEQLQSFPNLTDLDLSELPVEESDISALNARYPALHIRWMVPLLDDLRVDSDTESLDLRGYTVSDLSAFQQKLHWFSKLTYLDMCNCGPSDEEMAQLRSEFPQIKVVWMLHVGYWEIRTDIRAFSMAQDGEHEGVRFTKIGDEIRRYRWVDNEEIAKLRYCTDIEALDIGHSYLISDISFVRNLTKLRFLVISLTKVTDLSPVSTLKNMIFFEIFGLDITDVSVLYDLPQLEYLNCSADLITDVKPLLSLTNLKRLWIIKCEFSDDTLHALKVGLPNAIVIAKGKHPTDTGWRFGNPTYLEMQALFGLAPQLDWASAEYLLPENQIP